MRVIARRTLAAYWEKHPAAKPALEQWIRVLKSEVLGRERALTMSMAHKLHREWGMPAAVLIEPYELAS